MWMKLMYVRVMLIKLMDMMLMMYVMYDVEEVDIDHVEDLWCRCRWCRWCKRSSRCCVDEVRSWNLAAVLWKKKPLQELPGKHGWTGELRSNMIEHRSSKKTLNLWSSIIASLIILRSWAKLKRSIHKSCIAAEGRVQIWNRWSPSFPTWALSTLLHRVDKLQPTVFML